MIRTSVVVLVGVLLLAACGGTPTPTPTQVLPPTPTATVTLDSTPVPSATPTVVVTLMPSATPVPAVTPVANATPTPVTPDLPTPTATSPAGPPPIPDVGLVRVANVDFVVDIADDANEMTQGLSGRDSLDSDAGIWFVRDREFVGSFWMRGMKFPIDIIWIGSDMRVVDVTHSAPIPVPGTIDAALPRYSPKAPAAFVFEINAGLAEQLGIRRGLRVEFSRF